MPRLTELAPTLRGDAPPAARSGPQKFAVDVRESAIDGQGAFAAEPIPAGRKIGEIRGEAISAQEAATRARRSERLMLIAVSERRAIDASLSTDALRFANHACRPNAHLRVRQGRVELYALRALKAGEEITLNYGPTHHQGRLRCRCGMVGCGGTL